MVFLVDSTSNGMFSIFSTQPQPTITLIDPNGTQIDGSNADALGFTYQKVPGGSLFLPDESDPVPGATTLIVLPATAALGTYQLVVDGSQLTADSVISASYTSSFSIRAGVVSDASTYHLGNSVLLSALLFDGPTPITGASIPATIIDPAQPTAQAAEISVPDSGDCDDATGDGILITLLRAREAGRIRCFRIGTRVLYSEAQLVEFLDGCEQNGRRAAKRNLSELRRDSNARPSA